MKKSSNNGHIINPRMVQSDQVKSSLSLDDQLLYDKISSTIQLFDKVFRQVATCQAEELLQSLDRETNDAGNKKNTHRKNERRPIPSFEEVDPSPAPSDDETQSAMQSSSSSSTPRSFVEIPQSALTEMQCSAIAHLSGYLQSVFDIVYNYRIAKLHEQSIFSDLPLHVPTRCKVDGVDLPTTARANAGNEIEEELDSGMVTAGTEGPTTSSSTVGSPKAANSNSKNPSRPISENKKDKTIDFLHQKMAVLQEFLVNELNHSEELQRALHETESQLLQMTEERNMLQKKLSRSPGNRPPTQTEVQLPPPTGSTSLSIPMQGQNQQKPQPPVHIEAKTSSNKNKSTETATAKDANFAENASVIDPLVKSEGATSNSNSSGKRSSSSNLSSPSIAGQGASERPSLDRPTSMIGQYVRKAFDGRKYFGVIARYTRPFFMVVYEDGDNEEISKTELREVLWNGVVPSTRVTACTNSWKRLEAKDFQRNSTQAAETHPPPLLVGSTNSETTKVTTNTNISKKGRRSQRKKSRSTQGMNRSGIDSESSSDSHDDSSAESDQDSMLKSSPVSQKRNFGKQTDMLTSKSRIKGNQENGTLLQSPGSASSQRRFPLHSLSTSSSSSSSPSSSSSSGSGSESSSSPDDNKNYEVLVASPKGSERLKSIVGASQESNGSQSTAPVRIVSSFLAESANSSPNPTPKAMLTSSVKGNNINNIHQQVPASPLLKTQSPQRPAVLSPNRKDGSKIGLSLVNPKELFRQFEDDGNGYFIETDKMHSPPTRKTLIPSNSPLKSSLKVISLVNQASVADDGEKCRNLEQKLSASKRSIREKGYTSEISDPSSSEEMDSSDSDDVVITVNERKHSGTEMNNIDRKRSLEPSTERIVHDVDEGHEQVQSPSSQAGKRPKIVIDLSTSE